MSRAAAALKSKRAPSRKPAMRPRLTLRTLRGLLVLLLWSGAFYGIAYALMKMRPHAMAILGDGTWRYQWASTPPWFDDVREGVESDVARTLNNIQTMDLRDDGLSERVYTLLKDESPWIAAIHHVQKRADGVLLIDARFRKPLTRIDHNNISYLIDESGYLLPRRWAASDRTNDGVVHLEGASHGPPLAPNRREWDGQLWPGDDIQAGLKLVKFLHEQARSPRMRSQLLAVDISNFDRRLDKRLGQLRIRGIGSFYIDWGLPPGEEYGREPPASEKLARLLLYFEKVQSFPSEGRLDLRDFGPNVILEPPARVAPARG